MTLFIYYLLCVVISVTLYTSGITPAMGQWWVVILAAIAIWICGREYGSGR